MESNGDREVQQVIRSYKLLQLLNNHHNDCFAGVAFPSFIIITISVHALDTYMCIMVHDRISPPAFSFFLQWVIGWAVIQMGVYTVMGKCRDQSEELKRYCGMLCKTKVEQREIRAMRPLVIRAGHTWTVGRDTALGIILIVTDVTTNAIFIL